MRLSALLKRGSFHLLKERRKTSQHSPNEILKDPNWFKHLFDATFPMDQRLKFLSSPPSMDEDPYYVINKPSLRLAYDHPLITTRIEDQENVIWNALNATPDERSKPLIAVTKGKGGGKTRIIEEIKNSMNAKDDCLAVAVTFNHLTEINPSIDIFRGEDPMLSFALSIITRTISSVYKISHRSASKLLKGSEKILVQLSNEIQSNDFTDSLLRHFFAWILENHPTKKNIKNFIFLVDEYRQFIDEFIKYAKNGKSNEEQQQTVVARLEATPFSSALHKALLNQPILPNVRCCLVLSTLVFNDAIEKTGSGRKLDYIRLPEELQSEEVLTEWLFNPKRGDGKWLEEWKYRHRFFDLNDANPRYRQFRLIVELFNRLPRCLEFLENGLDEDRQQLKYPANQEIIEVNDIYIQRLVDYVFSQFAKMYKNTFPAPTLMMKFMQREEVDYRDPTIQDLLKDSTLVNTLDPINSEQMTPIASIVPLYNAAKRLVTSDLTIESKMIASEYLSTANEIIKMITIHEKAGDLLEYLCSHWIKFKFITMRESQRSLSLLDFFTISQINTKLDGEIFVHLRKLMIKIPEAMRRIEIIDHSNLQPTPKRKSDFVKLMNGETVKVKVKVNAKDGEKIREKMVDFKMNDVGPSNPIQLHTFHKGERFDLLLIVYDGSKPLLFFIETKSWKKSLEDPQSPLALPSTQYEKFRDKVVEGIRTDNTSVKSATMKSLLDGNYYFLYLTTFDDLQSFNREKAIVLTKEDSERFFSFMFPLFRALRGFMRNKTKKEL